MKHTPEEIKYRLSKIDDVIGDIALEYIEELEKENAELKEKNKWYSEQVCNKECAEVWGNLTKATKLIRSLYNYCCSAGSTGKATTEAERFLSEVEE